MDRPVWDGCFTSSTSKSGSSATASSRPPSRPSELRQLSLLGLRDPFVGHLVDRLANLVLRLGRRLDRAAVPRLTQTADEPAARGARLAAEVRLVRNHGVTPRRTFF